MKLHQTGFKSPIITIMNDKSHNAIAHTRNYKVDEEIEATNQIF